MCHVFRDNGQMGILCAGEDGVDGSRLGRRKEIAYPVSWAEVNTREVRVEEKGS